MRRIPLRRPSPALVVASVALLVTLGGTGYATVLQVPRASVGTPQLKNNAVTTGKLAANAVTSTKVRNGSLRRVDFVGGKLPAGPPGPTGPAGPAGPPGLSGVERIEATGAMNSVAFKGAFLACPGGKRLIGGGARINGGPNIPVALIQSFPDNDNVWRTSARETATFQGSWSVTVFAICAMTS
jgi:hypothetical protein